MTSTWPVPGESSTAAGPPLLVVDEVFLLRERLRELWTWAISLHVSPPQCLERARRDGPFFGSVAEVELRYRGRHLRGQASTATVPRLRQPPSS